MSEHTVVFDVQDVAAFRIELAALSSAAILFQSGAAMVAKPEAPADPETATVAGVERHGPAFFSRLALERLLAILDRVLTMADVDPNAKQREIACEARVREFLNSEPESEPRARRGPMELSKA